MCAIEIIEFVGFYNKKYPSWDLIINNGLYIIYLNTKMFKEKDTD